MSLSIKHIIISGRVQGVGFRQFVFNEARSLHLRGWVRNLQDGRVEVLVLLPADCQESFLSALRKGPRYASVTNLEVRDFSDQIKLDNFEVREDGSDVYGN